MHSLSYNPYLMAEIKRYIEEKKGWISFAEFMHKALYEPGLGYYVAGARKFGEEGDFVTAPEISSLFSQCLANQCHQIMQSGDSILEFGAGTGKMAADILLALEEKNSLPKYYFILEVSPDLQACQTQHLQKKCPHLMNKVQWLSHLPAHFTGVVLANEVLDAMPVHIFEFENKTFFERGVVIHGDDFSWEKKKIESKDSVLYAALKALNEGLVKTFLNANEDQNQVDYFPNHYFSEICLAIYPWLKNLYQSIQRGSVILIDYGFLEHEYYHACRNQGTLMCHYRHQAHVDPFLHLGFQDITAHVDFSAVANAAEKLGFVVDQYLTQANFLISLGILDYKGEDSLTEQYTQAQALKKLLLPSEMGELFKVLILNKK